MIVFAYQAQNEIRAYAPLHKQYDELAVKIKEKQKEKKALLVKQQDTSLFRPVEHIRLKTQIKENYPRQYDTYILEQAKANVVMLLGEEPIAIKPHPLREDRRQKKAEVQERAVPKKNKSRNLGR